MFVVSLRRLVLHSTECLRIKIQNVKFDTLFAQLVCVQLTSLFFNIFLELLFLPWEPFHWNVFLFDGTEIPLWLFWVKLNISRTSKTIYWWFVVWITWLSVFFHWSVLFAWDVNDVEESSEWNPFEVQLYAIWLTFFNSKWIGLTLMTSILLFAI